jgi:uncharacterized protein YcgI (DUF1989 family)
MAAIRIPAGTGRAVTLRAGQRLRIVNVEGGQVADFIAFNAVDLHEALSDGPPELAPTTSSKRCAR